MSVMTEEEIRTYAIKFATPYVTFWSELEANIKFWYHKTPQGVLLKCFSLKSRFSPRIARELFLLYNGVPLKLLDTLCSCHGGPRPIGGCAHAIAVLRLLSQLTNRVEPVQPTRSELMLKRALWHFQGSDSEGSTGSGSGSDSDTESSSSGSGVIDLLFHRFLDVLASSSVVCASFGAFQAVKRLLLSAVCRMCVMK